MRKHCFFIVLFLFSVVTGVAGESYNDILLIDDFNAATTDNVLGGKTEGDEEKEGGCIPLFTQNEVNTYGNAGHSLSLEYDVTFPGTFSFYSTKLGPQGADPFTSETRDLSSYAYFSFWYMTEMERPNFSIEVHRDSDNNGKFILGKDSSSKVIAKKYLRNHVPGTWHKVVIPLKDFAMISKWQNIVEFVFIFENALQSGSGKIFFDNILLGSNHPDEKQPDEIRFPGSMDISLAMVNGKRLSHAVQVYDTNNIDVLLKNVHPYLEEVAVEVWSAENNSWQRVSSFFNHVSGIYNGTWKHLSGTQTTAKLRIISVDVFGRERELAGPFRTRHVSD